MAIKYGVTKKMNDQTRIAPMGGQGYLQDKCERFTGESYAINDTFESPEVLKLPGMSGLVSINVFCSRALSGRVEFRTVGDGRGAPTSNWTQFANIATAAKDHVLVPNTTTVTAEGRALFYTSDMTNREFRFVTTTAGAAGDVIYFVLRFMNI